MSIKCMSKVWQIDNLEPSQKLVFLSICDNANDEGICYPSINTIQSKTSLSRPTVIKIINTLGIDIECTYDKVSNKMKQINLKGEMWMSFKIGDLVEYKDYRNGSIKEVIKDINLEEGIYHVRISDKESRLIPFENVIKE